LLSWPTQARAQDDACNRILHADGQTPDLKPSDLHPHSELWRRLTEALFKKVENVPHPFEQAGVNADALGRVIQQMTEAFPDLAPALRMNQNLESQSRRLSPDEYAQFMRPIARDLIRVAKTSADSTEVFAALETVNVLGQIESQVDFPKTEEQIQAEERKQEEEREKKKDEDQEEQEPEWNQTQDQYQPENKDISDQDGPKKKNVALVLTDVQPPKALMRQKIYDQFDYQDWKSLPSSRLKMKLAAHPTKKLILDPLKARQVDVPVPYGYALKPGHYGDYEISEVGAGEYVLHVLKPSSEKKPIAMDLYEITGEKYLPSLSSATEKYLSLFPEHLRLFAESLKGLPPVEAAARLEKYLSREGGFLYYSKGNQISEEKLKELESKYQQLLSSGLPKPVAMANLGAFNCDGAAWIGGLILRDLLKIPVRLAGGRTVGGFKTIDGQKMYVIQSSSDAHAWLEVYDGTHWVPFDMTPKNNVPDRSGDPSDLQQERKEDQADQQADQQPSEGQPSDAQPSPSDSQEEKGEKAEQKSEKTAEEGAESGAESSTENSPATDEMIRAKSSQGSGPGAPRDLVGTILSTDEKIFFESLIRDGFKTKVLDEFQPFYASLEGGLHAYRGEASWRKMQTLLEEARYQKYPGLNELLREIRNDFSQDHPLDGKVKLDFVDSMFKTLSEFRPLTDAENTAVENVQKILTVLNRIKHANAKEYEAVRDFEKNLPGNVSKQWLKKVYGEDYDRLGSAACSKLAQDIVSGKLKSILEEQKVVPFVDMTLNSTVEPQWKDEPTLNKSPMPKPRQDLVVTRNPLDFAKMLWNLRPGEPIFAPTLQGRQFAVGSLETRRVVDPKHPIERKISVVYYDISGSMSSEGRSEVVDALLMAYVDRALSETDAIGRPIHEVYLLPFNDQVKEGVHIATREDALNFFANRVNYQTQVSGGTDIQKAILHFYKLIQNSYRSKQKLGREAMFQKANMILFTDGGSSIDTEALLAERSQISSDVKINMNLVSVGNEPNQTLKELVLKEGLSSEKPKYREIHSDMLNEVVSVKQNYKDNAFATDQKLNGQMVAEIDRLLKGISVDPKLQANAASSGKLVGQLGLTKTSAKDLSGASLRVALQLSQMKDALMNPALSSESKRRIVEAILNVYPNLIGRSLRELTISEKENLERIYQWAFME